MVPFMSSSAVDEPLSGPQEATCEHCLRLQHQKDTQLAYLGSFSHDLLTGCHTARTLEVITNLRAALSTDYGRAAQLCSIAAESSRS